MTEPISHSEGAVSAEGLLKEAPKVDHAVVVAIGAMKTLVSSSLGVHALKPLPPIPTTKKVDSIGPSTILIGDELDPRPLKSSKMPDMGPFESTISFEGMEATERVEIVPTKKLTEGILNQSMTLNGSKVLTRCKRFCSLLAGPSVLATSLREAALTEHVSDIAVIQPTNLQVHTVQEGKSEVLRFEQFGALTDNCDSYNSCAKLEKSCKDPVWAGDSVQLKRLKSPKVQAGVQLAIKAAANPLEALKERRLLLDHQMLIVVYNRLMNAAKAGTIENGQVHLSHLSLLNPNLKLTDSRSGIHHDESSMIEDMQDTFNRFDGKGILFDAKDAPYLDDIGLIHMPKIVGISDSEVKLHTHYGNVAVRGKRTKEGDLLQTEVNKKLLDDMTESLTKRFPTPTELKEAGKILDHCRKELSTHTQSCQVAADLLEVQILLGWQVSTGCYSNKDRGGVVGAMLCTTHLAFMKNVASLNVTENEAKRFHKQAEDLRKSGLRALETNSIQRQVAAFNSTGQTALRMVSLSDVRSPRGFFSEIVNAAALGKDVVSEKIRSCRKRLGLSVF